ncbi:MAG: Hsp20/alpha crystallin family protein [Deltaproteobacteria bacterium]|nr:Hsp20/alpha crystallin family protein [Deltaproteobacteria bacterium]
MPGLIIWKDEEITKMKRDMERLMSRLRTDMDKCLFPAIARRTLSFQFSEREDRLILRAYLPDVDPEDIHVFINGEVLTVRGQQKFEFCSDENSFRRRETRRSAFIRTFRLPCRVDVSRTEALHKNGLLQVVMPKCGPEEIREIPIRTVD